ncbi:MAG: transcription-repair coupling factor [Gammaproteobacteria bacterium]|nr:transcription-repair coupling factor [Gammaproteobacteria bacterium]
MIQHSPHNPPAAPKPGNLAKWHGLYEGSAYLAAIKAAVAHESPTIVIANNAEDALNWFNGLSFFAEQEGNSIDILRFPEWETLPYDGFSPQNDIVSERLATLRKLSNAEKFILIISLQTLIQKIPPPKYIQSYSLQLCKGQKLNITDWALDLASYGYMPTDVVRNRGEYATRGSLIDIFPMGADTPIRIDLLEDQIDSLRTFDPETQRTITLVDKTDFLPAKEFPFNDEAISRFQEAWHLNFDVDVRNCAIYQDVSNGILANGVEYYLPFFFDELSTIFDYMPTSNLVISQDGLPQEVTSYIEGFTERYESLRHDVTRPILPPDTLLILGNELTKKLNLFSQIILSDQTNTEDKVNFKSNQIPKIEANPKLKEPGSALKIFVDSLDVPCLFVVNTAGRREMVQEFLHRTGIKARELKDSDLSRLDKSQCGIYISTLDRGIWTDQLCIITETQIFDIPSRQRKPKGRLFDPELIIRNLTELKTGDPVVHIEHGIGRYKGLSTLSIDGNTNEFLSIEYEEEAILYVPVTSLHLVTRYSSNDLKTVSLSRLGSESWKKTREKAAKKIYDVAAELLDVQAQREQNIGHQFPAPDQQYWQFVQQFSFEVTDDQQTAIDAVIEDLTSSKSIDRLVCGDVGFGKTEVAMRASFIAANSGAQVIVLAPTTLLAQQHLDTWTTRFADWPIRIEMLSRLRSDTQINSILDHLKNGKIDIVIGTHKLLTDRLEMPNLGLVVVDEEHRFGVRQKEKLKKIRANVDFLTLTATPIPRTLNMAINSMRDLSIIATAPNKRVPILTFLYHQRDHIIKEAIKREILRGGQVFYLHNEVRTINQASQYVKDLVPEAKIGIAHGKMAKGDMEQVMNTFYHRQINVLVCTTIIENGIDVPNANTIIIQRADKFGLSQLHQLRGRVGRSTRQAYAYLLIPDRRAISADALKRLEAIESSGDLGMGFTLATHDLEIRGAGELLGEDQSGQIESLGFSLYMQLLERTIASLRKPGIKGLIGPIEPSSEEINLHSSTLIPETYLPDVHERLILYKRIAGASTTTEIEELKVEIIDRFGKLPDETRALLAITELKNIAQKIGISKIDIGSKGGRIQFSEKTSANPERIIELISQEPDSYQFQSPSLLRLRKTRATFQERLELATHIIQYVSPTEKVLE